MADLSPAIVCTPEPEREIVRCPHCELRQYVTWNRKCRRCQLALRPDEQPHVPAASVPADKPGEVASAIVRRRNFPIVTRHYSGGTPSRLLKRSGIAGGIVRAIRLARVAQGLSQRQLTEVLGMPRPFISKIENGIVVPKPATVIKLARGLNVSAYFLVRMAEELAAAEAELASGDLESEASA